MDANKLHEIFLETIREAKEGTIILKTYDEIPFTFHLKMYVRFSSKNDFYAYGNVEDSKTPVLKINNPDNFFKALEETLDTQMKFHGNDLDQLFYEQYIKYLMAMTFANMTQDDFENPVKYLKETKESYKKENMLFKEGLTYLKEITIEDEKYKFSVQTDRNRATLESPYAYTFRISNMKNHFIFPTIYAINDGTTMTIRALQNKETFVDEQSKNLSDYLKGILPKVNSNEKILRNVTPSFVIGLGLFMETAKEKGITNFRFPTYSPLRYYNKLSALNAKSERNTEDKNELKEKYIQNEEFTNTVQTSVTNKLLQTALRLQTHKNEYEIKDVGENGSYLILKYNKELEKEEDFLKDFLNGKTLQR